MILVNYYYTLKCGKRKQGTTYFSDRVACLRFIYSIKKEKDMFLIGWQCEYPDDNEYLSRRISILDINSK